MRQKLSTRTLVLGAVLTAGPYATVRYVEHLAASPWLRTDQLGLAVGVALAMWSPLFFSFPALLLQGARDAALPELRGPVGTTVRAVRLVPHLLSDASPVRVEMGLSLVGFAIGAAYAASLL